MTRYHINAVGPSLRRPGAGAALMVLALVVLGLGAGAGVASAAPVAQISTTAQNADPTLGKMVVQGSSLTDTISYQGLVAGTAYSAAGEFMYVDGSGSTGITSTATFTPTAATGTTTLTLPVPDGFAAAHAGQSIVAYTTVTAAGDITPVASQQDRLNVASRLTIPSFTFHVTNSDPHDAALDRIIDVRKPLDDTITYTGLTPGLTYTIKLTADTVNPSGNLSPTQNAGAATFIPSATDGIASASLIFAPDPYDAAGSEYLVLETVSVGKYTLATHGDPKDPTQVLYSPLIQTSTTTTDPNAAVHKQITAGTMKVTLEYSALEPGKTYQVHLGFEGDSLYPEFQFNASPPFQICAPGDCGADPAVSFTATRSSGRVVTNLHVSQALLEKWSWSPWTVAGSITTGGATAALINDCGFHYYCHSFEFLNAARLNLNQFTAPTFVSSIANKIPALGKTAQPNGTLLEKLSYSLPQGQRYSITGELIAVSDDHAPIHTGITWLGYFSGSSFGSGTAGLRFELPSDLSARFGGDTLVAVEAVHYKGITLATYSNLNDPTQMVHVVGADWVLHGPDRSTGTIPVDDGVTLTDTLTYSNLIPGGHYVISGQLRRHDGSSTGVTVARAFTAQTASGTVDVTFAVPADLQADGTLVVTAQESLALVSAGQTIVVAGQSDSADQSVTLAFGATAPTTTVINPGGSTAPVGAINSGEGATGTHANSGVIDAGLAVLLLACATAAATTMTTRRKRRRSGV